LTLAPDANTFRVEPTIALEWAQAVEQPTADSARTPADGRGGWLHQAPEREVLARYRAAGGLKSGLPAPWWLRALAAGTLGSRAEGFAVEDRVARLLDARSGWVFVPWGFDGDTGYWEYMPSERTLTEPGVPTTLSLTDRHSGWIDVYPVHAGEAQRAPVAVAGLADLRANLARIESLS
jgi:hypothetical protein